MVDNQKQDATASDDPAAGHRSQPDGREGELRDVRRRLDVSRTRYFSLFDHSPLPYFIARENLSITEVNLAASELLSIDRSRIVGGLLTNFIVEGERDVWHDNLAEVLAHGRCAPFDSVLCTATGARRHVNAHIHHLAPETERPDTLLLVALVDVTDRVQSARDRQLLDSKLLESQRVESMGILACGVAHDLNNLVTGILTAAALLKEALPAESKAISLASHIVGAGQKTADLCNQLLVYAGKGQITLVPTEVNPLLSDLLGLLSVSVPKKHKLLLEATAQLPAVLGDATQLRQIVMNLVVNASEAIGDHEGEVLIRTGVERIVPKTMPNLVAGADLPDGDYVFLEVEDSGCGMSSHTLARIFDPFYTTKFTGRGLGLAAVIGIVRSHRGLLVVRSQLGQGSTFRLWLPVASASTSQSQVAREASPVRAEPLTGARVLVVDDDPIVRQTLGLLLRRLGCHVRFEQSGQEAVRTLKGPIAPPDAILLDATMPGWDGPQTFAAAREAGYHGPIFLMSEHSVDDLSGRHSHLKAAGFLKKPIAHKDLSNKVGAVLMRRGLS
jgi:two-component system, cell cycle sensor histidine kinase and response regulator CckA